MYAPPPPPPPAPAALPMSKGVTPSTSKALLTSIEKGTKLKKVPESLKNDRSSALASKDANRPSSQFKSSSSSVNGTQSYDKSGPPMLNMKAELASHLSSRSNINMRKESAPVVGSNVSGFANFSTSIPKVRAPMAYKLPPPNQNPRGINKPPPPPPLNKKPNFGSRNSYSEPSKPMPTVPCDSGRANIQSQLIKKAPPPIPIPQVANKPVTPMQSTRAALPNQISSWSSAVITREAPKAPIILHQSSMGAQPQPPPPPVPQRAPSTVQPPNFIVSGDDELHQNQSIKPRLALSSGENQYNVRDRLPPPPPTQLQQHNFPTSNIFPFNSSSPTKTGSSSFDQRFNFPKENTFPSLKQLRMSSECRLSQSPFNHVT